MSIVLSSFWLQWVEVAIGKSILILYQYGFLTIDDTNKSYSLWHTSDENQMIKITKFERIEFLYFGSLLLWHYNYTLAIGLGGIIGERVCATIFINDYEKKSRTWIPILIVSAVHLISIPISFVMIQNKTTIEISISGMFLMTTMFLTSYFYVLKFNRRKEIQKNLNLSQKFQIKENIRAISILKIFILVVVAYIISIGILIMLLYMKIVQGALLDHTAENLIALNPIVHSFVLMSCSKVWAQKFFPFETGKYFHFHGETDQILMANDSTMYFNQLKNAWT